MAETYASKATSNTTRSGPRSLIMGMDSMPAIEDVVPFEILQSCVLTWPSTSASSGVGSPASRRIRSPPPSTFITTSATNPNDNGNGDDGEGEGENLSDVNISDIDE